MKEIIEKEQAEIFEIWTESEGQSQVLVLELNWQSTQWKLACVQKLSGIG